MSVTSAGITAALRPSGTDLVGDGFEVVFGARDERHVGSGLAKARAMPRPMPFPAPVTRAAFRPDGIGR